MTTLLEEMGAQIADSLSVLATPATLTTVAGVDHTISIIEEGLDRKVISNIAKEERVVLVFGLVGIEPKARDKLTIDGKALTVNRSSRTGMGAAWEVVVT